MPLHWVNLDPHLINSFLGPLESARQKSSWSVEHIFEGFANVTNRRLCYSVYAIGYIYDMHATQPN